MQRNLGLRKISFVVTVLAASLLVSCVAQAQSPELSASKPALSSGSVFTEKSGEQLFSSVCRGCHMPDGKGAAGAGTYPSLAGNRNLEASGYPIEVVVNGQRGMPSFGSMMSDDQVAAVVNYLRTHFGNNYRDEVRADDVKAVRR
ncbi:c-type cytochrome [Bradyrhizobium sp.]|jgi:mono/diheme cytochrome c family protein|uniref:c-type cytochrome n=1 Tax=Bradyrhizobium sp. TaxID=376 RepID=UPI003C173D59